jgi:hydrogenase maturation protein HypF
MTASATRLRIRVEGIVQGVGFRPFVCGLAVEHGLAGFVGNDAEGVFIEAEGTSSTVDEFLVDLRRRAPALAVIERVETQRRSPTGQPGFRIVPTPAGGIRRTLVSPDMATCGDCLAELWDPADRRYRYPFINCTNCGPRYTILTDVPYDRPATTMGAFSLCDGCAAEYADPGDRRFHAEPVCCPACGPTLRMIDAGGRPVPGEPIETRSRSRSWSPTWMRRGPLASATPLPCGHSSVPAGRWCWSPAGSARTWPRRWPRARASSD